MLAAPDAPVDRLGFVSEPERDMLLRKFNATELAPSALLHSGQTMHGLLDHWASTTPDAIAAIFKVCQRVLFQCYHDCDANAACLPSLFIVIRFEHGAPCSQLVCVACINAYDMAAAQDESLTYAELDKRANQLAHRLVALGVGPEVPVGVMIPRSLHLVVALLGVLKAGGAYVPMDSSYPPDRLALMVEDSEVGMWL